MRPKIVVTDTGKICTRCDRDLPLVEFYRQKDGTLGLRSECDVDRLMALAAYLLQHSDVLGSPVSCSA